MRCQAAALSPACHNSRQAYEPAGVTKFLVELALDINGIAIAAYESRTGNPRGMQVAMPGSYGYNRSRCAFAHGRTVVHVYVWHYIAGLAVAVLIIMIALNALNSSAKASRESFARAAPAVARVLKVGKSTSSHSYRGVVIDLLIQVHPRGAEPYELNTMWAIDPDAVSKVQVGKTLDIKIDLQDPTKIYSNEIWARSLGVMKEPIKKSGD